MRSVLVLCLGLLVAGCSGGSNSFINDATKFSSGVFGVAASPRLTRSAHVPRGGGRYQVGSRYRVAGRWYTPAENPNYDESGTASWYGPNFHGRQTANGEIFDQFHLSAAHPTLPLPSYVRVQNLDNGRSVIVRVNDRGPFAHNRLIDLSRRAADVLGFINTGTANVRVTYVGRAPLEGDDTRYLVASINAPAGTPPPSSSRMALSHINQRSSASSGGLFGAVANIFSYTDDTEVGEAEQAIQNLANQTAVQNVNIDLGAYYDVTEANEVARIFALLGAVDHTQVTQGGNTISSLTLTALKAGVSLADVERFRVDLEIGQTSQNTQSN